MPAIAADAGVVIIAIMAILLVLALYFLLQALIAFFEWVGVPNWPLIGGNIMHALQSAAHWASGVAGWLWQHANPVNIVVATVHFIVDEFGQVEAWGLSVAVGALNRITTQVIPGAINYVSGIAHTLYNDSIGWINTEITAVRVVISSDIAHVEAVIASDINAARTFSVQLYGDAIAWTDHEFAIAEAAAQGLVQSLQGWVVQELGQLRTWVTGEIGTATQTLEGDINAGLHGLEQTLAPEIAAAAAVGAAAAAEFAQWRRGCGDPLCNNLLTFGNIISSLEGLLSDGVLIALVAGAVADPAGTVRVIRDDFAVPVEDAVSTVLGAVGLNLQRAA